VHSGGLYSVDLEFELVRGIRDVAGDLVVHGHGDEALGADGDGTALGEIGGAGDVKLVLVGGAGCEGGQGLIGEAITAEPQLDPGELNLGGLNSG
jgi:hypothetical protein